LPKPTVTRYSELLLHITLHKVTKPELKLLQKDIESIIRPPYRQAPPRDLGNPVSVAQLWSRETAPPDQDRDVTARRDKVFQSIMHLAVAVRYDSSAKQHGEISIKFYCIDAVAMPPKGKAGGFKSGMRHLTFRQTNISTDQQ